jgi:hypothetical protein
MHNYRFFVLFLLALWSLPSAKAVTIHCDGVTPDDVAINSVLAAGGELRLPVGTCIINNPLIIPNHGGGVSNVSLRGAGFYATFIQVSSSFTAPQMISVNGSTTITDLQLNGQGKSTWGIRNSTATASIPSFFKNLSFASLAGTGTGTGTGTGGGFLNEGAGAIYNISDCFFNSANFAIYNADWGTNSIISHNDVLGGQGFFFTNSGLPGHSNEGILIDGNNLVSLGGAGTMKFEHCLNCIISNNIVDDNSASSPPYSLNITGGSLYKVTNNWFGKGTNADHSSELYFSGNTYANGFAAVFSITSNVQFANNVLQNAAPQCQVNCSAGQSLFILDSTNVQVHHNNLQNLRGAIYVGGNTHLLVESNVFSATCARSGSNTFIFNTGGTGCGNSLSYPTTW